MFETGISPADIAAVTRDGDGWGGNSAWVLIILFALIFGWGGNGFGGRGAVGEPVTEAGLCNSMNFNNLENAVGRLNDSQAAIARQTDNAICQIGYQNAQLANQTQRDLCQGFAAVNAGLNQNRFDLQQCCCNTEKELLENRYLAAQNTCEIIQSQNCNTQKILDAITGNRMADMQNQINQLQLQSALCGVIRYPNATTYSAGMNPCFNVGTCGCC